VQLRELEEEQAAALRCLAVVASPADDDHDDDRPDNKPQRVVADAGSRSCWLLPPPRLLAACLAAVFVVLVGCATSVYVSSRNNKAATSAKNDNTPNNIPMIAVQQDVNEDTPDSTESSRRATQQSALRLCQERMAFANCEACVTEKLPTSIDSCMDLNDRVCQAIHQDCSDSCKGCGALFEAYLDCGYKNHEYVKCGIRCGV